MRNHKHSNDCKACRYVFGTKEVNGVGVLGIFKGHTVDFKLSQFRKVSLDGGECGPIEFIDFDSQDGKKLVSAMHKAAIKELGGPIVWVDKTKRGQLYV